MVIALVDKIKLINTVSSREYYEICSTFSILTEPRYRCYVCLNKFKHEPERREKLEANMACKYKAAKPRHEYTPDFNNKSNPGIQYNNCVGNHFYGKWSGIINNHYKYDKGENGFEGGYMEQPSKFVEVMELVHNLIIENEKSIERKNSLQSRNRSGRK